MRFQDSDNQIFINNTMVPKEWFLTQEPNYSELPENCIGRLYVPGKRHHVTMMKGETPCQCEGEHDNHVWAEGEAYIAKEAEYAAAYELFANPPPTQAEIDASNLEIEILTKREEAIEELLETSNTAKAVLYKESKAKRIK